MHNTQKTAYKDSYLSSLLKSLPRQEQRQPLGITGNELPFDGFDIWNAYEFSWLNAKGRPEVALARFQMPVGSVNFIESKSFKLYLGSCSNTKFALRSEVVDTLKSDLSRAINAPVKVLLMTPEEVQKEGLGQLCGTCLDYLDVEISEYRWNPELLELEKELKLEKESVQETLYTHLFRSLCPITGQPDLGSITVQYEGLGVRHEGLLKYLVSYRNQAAFGEQITEQIFVDIMKQCTPRNLAVIARFNRRGGIDINVHRTSELVSKDEVRIWRQ